MSLLPQETILGNLEIIEVYEYYDKPCLFSCRNATDHFFLAVWIDETVSLNSWLYVSTSLKRLQQIVSGRIELRDAFLCAENNFVFEAHVPRNEGNSEIARISCSDLEEDKLP
jgi:hypothetical protein